MQVSCRAAAERVAGRLPGSYRAAGGRLRLRAAHRVGLVIELVPHLLQAACGWRVRVRVSGRARVRVWRASRSRSLSMPREE